MSEADRAATRVFDLIDGLKLGQAEGALETALAKYPTHPAVRAAEALFLLRQGRSARATEKAEQLARENIVDPQTINALVHVLQQCCCWASLAATYERIKHLQNEQQIMENLVQTYVRMGAYDKAQSTAMQLFRKHSDPKYQVWVVQACAGQVPLGSTDHLQLKLCTRMLDTAVLTAKGKQTPSTTRMYVDLLLQQEQPAAAVDFLCSPRGAFIGLLETRLESLARALRLAGRPRAASAAWRHLWCARPDNWTPFEQYVDALAAAAADPDTAAVALESERPEQRLTLDVTAAGTSLEAALELARALQADERAQRPSKLQRGPFLAELLLLQRLGDAAALEAAVLAYAQTFFRKPCAFLDISTFLTPASAAAVYEWSQPPQRQQQQEGEAEAAQLDVHTARILGLRAYVSQWGCTADTAPAEAAMQELLAQCRTLYEEARPLSAELAWSEEGHGDGYLCVGLNIALRGYVASGRQLHWVARGLELMHDVDRRMSNSAWLLFSVCFAQLLRLGDLQAHRQLAFKDVQHDTMTHLGYWPLWSALALSDIAAWEETRAMYVARHARDCSLLRAKIFNFLSWPAMQDVLRFDHTQTNSFVRWCGVPHQLLAKLPECQTQKNVFELFDTYRDGLWESWEALTDGRELLDNTDWLVAKSLVLGDIHGPQVQELTEALVALPPFTQRHAAAVQLLQSLLLLHDVATLEQQRQRPPAKSCGGASKAARKKAAAATAEPAPAGPPLYCVQIVAQRGALEVLPVLAPLVAALLPYLQSGGATAVPHSAAWSAVLEPLVDPSQTHAAAWESALYPEVYIAAALLQVADVRRLPVQGWASDLVRVLEAASQRYAAGSWCTTPVEVEGAFGAALKSEKERRVSGMLSELLVGVSASTRRK
ncbi:hypothetical protein STCU_05237 [Strigomonas culicis]|uniref:Uncharacterized protein n=1 Tax=Strigomonas culicis TaxID=28005 RepID=S9UH20_9TRYP|nr:hypothetical protein STCU_05237 [Strigomonas culicis]|eukprot:EPY28228.1 hypothetical protein STCU_05237 [Strigomonas culicis]